MSDRAALAELFRGALRAVHAGAAVERALADSEPGPVTLLAAGKAAVAMAAGARNVLGERVRGGAVVTKDGHAQQVPGLIVREAAHPVPDARGVAAADEALAIASALGSDDRLLVLLSGGASALWSAPVPEVLLEEKQLLTEQLLRAGVDIARVNTVRKHISRIKGGRLAEAAHPAAVHTLAVSDVAGDVFDAIGSGPTSPDPTTYGDAIDVLESAGLARSVPASVLQHLRAGTKGEQSETPKPGSPLFERCEFEVIANLDGALAAVEREARTMGLQVRVLGRALDGEARDRARGLADELEGASREGIELLVAGGEPTVTVRGDGLGGRAQELALAFALAADGPYTALFAGTDGTDGPTDAAGAIVDPGTLARGQAAGLDPQASLDRNDSNRFLAASGDLLVTGPTNTNVNDLGLIRIGRLG